MFVFSRTIDQQSEVERYHRDLTGRVGDVLGNVSVVQSYVRLDAEAAALKTSCAICWLRSIRCSPGGRL